MEPENNEGVSTGLIPVPSELPQLSSNQKRPLSPTPLLSQDEISGISEVIDAKKSRTEPQESGGNRKIYIGNLPPSVTEKALVAYFRAFGHVVDCSVVRDKDSGISRGFAFLTFLTEEEADTAVDLENHKLDGKPIRVSYAQKNASSIPRASKKTSEMKMDDVVLPNQTRIYLGPLDDDIENQDIIQQLHQYGVIKGVSKLVSAVKRSIAYVDFKDSISVRRVFSNKIFLKGKLIRVACSKIGLELILSKTVVFFYECHESCSKDAIDVHFSQFGQLFRGSQITNEDGYPKPYGFVDFVESESVSRAIQSKQQLINNQQYIRVSRYLPHNLMMDLMALSEKLANAMVRKMEQALPDQSVWGSQGFKSSSDHATSQVRIPSKLVPRLIGERGKNIAGVCRDSKTKISIPRTRDGVAKEDKIVISITGTQMDIKTAQYLMKKLLQPN